MQVPFDQFVVPSAAHLAVLLTGTAVVAAILYAVRPPVTQRVVVAFVPWIVVGATLHVFYQLGLEYGQVYPDWAAPFFSAPSVYLTTFVAMGVVWLATTMVGTTATTSSRGDGARYLLAVGTGVAVTLLGLLAWQATGETLGDPNVVVPTVGLVISGVLAFALYVLVGMWRAYIIAEARYVGALVIFAHVLDGVTTAVGVDVLGTTERSVLPRRIMELAGDLPTAEYIGQGWLFVFVKGLLAVLIVAAFADYVSERPTHGNLLFAAIVAVGLGPAVNNILLFMLGLGV